MSVVGIGTDIIEISRIANMKDKARENLANRVLTQCELEKYQQLSFPIPFLAKRWAAKEAASKALGTGIADGVSFQHFEVNSLKTGQPILSLTGRAHEVALALGASTWHISLADEKKFATAFVILSS